GLGRGPDRPLLAEHGLVPLLQLVELLGLLLVAQLLEPLLQLLQGLVELLDRPLFLLGGVILVAVPEVLLGAPLLGNGLLEVLLRRVLGLLGVIVIRIVRVVRTAAARVALGIPLLAVAGGHRAGRGLRLGVAARLLL